MQPFVDFTSLRAVIVLVPETRWTGFRPRSSCSSPRSSRCPSSASTRRSAPRASSSSRSLSVALLRGSVFGAIAGFGTGLLLDTASLGTLGVTSLLLTIAGFWIGRYGETTARDRFHAPYLSVAVVTVLYAYGQILLRFVLGEPARGRDRHPRARRSRSSSTCS